MPTADQSDLTIRLLGPLHIDRGGTPLVVPASRKARAILGYLVMSPRPVTRQRLCDMFFDAPDDPRASLRWILTKLRAVVDDPETPRIVAVRDTLAFAPAGAMVDVLDVLRPQPTNLLHDVTGAFLEDGELPERRDFMLWLQTAREELRTARIARLTESLSEADLSPERHLALGRALQAIEPLDEGGQRAVVRALTRMGRLDEARASLADAERAFRRAGLSPSPALRAATTQVVSPPPRMLPPNVASPRSGAQLIDMQPCVAILPFQNYSPDAIADELMNGFLESVIHMVSRFRMLRVLSLTSSLELKGRMSNPGDLYARAGANYIVGGSIVVRDDVAKLRYRIVDAATAALLSSGDIQWPSPNTTALTEDLPAHLTTHVALHCIELSRARAGAKAESERHAVDHYMHGMECAYHMPVPDFPTALRAFESAIALHPNYPAAMASAAHAKAVLRVATEEPARTATIEQAHAAIALGEDDAYALSLAAWALVQVAQDVEPALRAAEAAIRLNPLARIVWTVNGWIRAMNGEVETPLAHWERAEQCSPVGGSMDLAYSGRALCLWMAGRHEDSLAWAKRSLERVPNNPGALTAGVAAAFMLDDMPALRQFGPKLLRHYPEGANSPVIAGVPIVATDKRDAILQAVRAGLAAIGSSS